MQSLVDIVGKMRREMEARHAAQDKGPSYKTKPTLWRESFKRASCPECNGRAAANCQTCQGSGLVCPACRGAGHVRRDEVKSGAPFEEAIGRCPRCEALDDKRRGIEAYLVAGAPDIWGTVDGEFCEPVEIPMAPRQEQRGYWRDEVQPEAPAEPKRGWVQYTEPGLEAEAKEAPMLAVDTERFTWEPPKPGTPLHSVEEAVPGKQETVARKFLKQSMQRSVDPVEEDDIPF